MFPSRRIAVMGSDKFRDEYSVSFDGTDEYIDCGDSTSWDFDNGSNSKFHINIWVKLTASTSSEDSFIGKYDGAANKREWRISLDGSRNIKCVFSSNGIATASAVTSNALALNRWYNIGVTYNGSQGTADN